MFDKVDFVTIIVLIIVIGVYMYVLAKNNLLFKKSNNNQIYSLLDKNQSLLFEIIEICVLFVIPILLYKEKQYILAGVFALEFLEHINQVIFCYRQDLNSLQILTIVLDFIFILYAYYKKCYWTIPLFIIGIAIHVVSLYYNKSFSNIVCISDIFCGTEDCNSTEAEI